MRAKTGSLAWCVIAVLLAGCSSGSDSGGGGSPTGPQSFTFSFTPDSAPPNNSVSIQAVPDGDGVRFRVVATALTNLHSYDYQVSLPPLLRFTTGQADFGDFLVGGQSTSGGARDTNFEFAVALGPTQPARSGNGSLGSAGRYALTTAGQGRVEFARALFRDGAGQPLQGLSLIGGTLRVTAN
jgi:hypothetical protein